MAKFLENMRASSSELNAQASARLSSIKEDARKGGFFRTPVLLEEPKDKVIPVAKTVHALLVLERGLRHNFLTIQETADQDAAIEAGRKMKIISDAIESTSLGKILDRNANPGFVLMMWDAGFNTEMIGQINRFFSDFPGPAEVCASPRRTGGCIFYLSGEKESNVGEMRFRKTKVSFNKLLGFKTGKPDFPIISTDYLAKGESFMINQADLSMQIPDSLARKTKNDPVAHVIRMLDEAGLDVGEVLWRMQTHLQILLPGEGLLAQPHQYAFSMKLVQGPIPAIPDFLQAAKGESKLPTRLVTEASMKYSGEGMPNVKVSLIFPDAWLTLDAEIGGQKVSVADNLSEFKK